MNKKKITRALIFSFAVILGSIAAVTQEAEYFNDIEEEIDFETGDASAVEDETEEEVPPYYGYIYLKETPEWVLPVRWFKSNAGGLAIEETSSRMTALRNDYALSVSYIQPEDLPNELHSFYNDDFLIEERILYNKRNPVKTQWVFRDYEGLSLLIAVFSEDDERTGFIEIFNEEGILTTEYNYQINEKNKIDYVFNEKLLVSSSVSYWKEIKIPREKTKDEVLNEDDNESVKTGEFYAETEEITADADKKDEDLQIENNEETGDEIAEETEEDLNEETDEEIAEEIQYDITGEYQLAFMDTFFYNRSMFLRTIERKYYSEADLTFSDEPVRVSLPSSIKEAVEERFSGGTRYNTLPEYFGVMTVSPDSKMVYTTDERGRILTQTLFDNEDNIIWVITNTWQGDRIQVSVKEEGEIVLRTEYEYNSSGDRTAERNFRDGNLERYVRTEGKTDYEELYLDNVLILTAVWEDGRKISESRVRNN